MVNRGELRANPARRVLMHDVPGINAPRTCSVGLGSRDAADAPRFIKAAAAAITALKTTPAKTALCCLLDAEAGGKDAYWKTRRIVEQFEEGVYRYVDMKGKPPENETLLEGVDIQLASREDQDTVDAGIDDGVTVALGIMTHKNLSNAPGNVCTPTYLADQAKKLAREHKSVTTSILDEDDMMKLGMGAFIAVSQGSDQPGKLIVMEHKGGDAGEQPYVLVGKGITFDTGGISLKPGQGMHEMIWDMCGAASVFGAMTTVAAQQLPLNVIGVVAAAENMPSARATRPGDIVKSMSGQTIEILNTDAEGRLVLCDALTYIDKFKPKTVIDIATLTGAAVVALGAPASAMYSNDEELAEDLEQAGEESWDRVWRMPLWEEYQSQLNSAFADMQNIGGREAGSVTAACFLSRFTRKYRWAHLDIAGSAYRANGTNKGATGRPVGTLTQYLMDRADEAEFEGEED
ncbi:MAG: leucyl aminopeptidase [Gammaproteobacteria bacterium]|nr:leucyl aminopeptidase [Gammaproteobacteria bacterium]